MFQLVNVGIATHSATSQTINFQAMQARQRLWLVLLVLSGHVRNGVQALQKRSKPLVPAVYIFGDSTVDPGNNNHLGTVVKANFPPYGRDFINHEPTGRFSNGKLPTDILSSLAGLSDIVPAYLDPKFQGDQILKGASFASAASGYDDSTAKTLNVLTLKQQLDLFKEYKVRVEGLIGKENASSITSEAIFALSTGSDDLANNYFFNHLTRHKYSVEQYLDLLLRSLSQFVKNIYNAGAKKIAVLGLPPIGCLPSQITLHNLVNKTCVEEENDAAILFNNKLIVLLETMKFPALKIVYIDIYDKLFDAIKNPAKYGFEKARKACCGTGLVETAILCNQKSPTCADASKYVFWDSYHPTESMYQILADDIFRQGKTNHLI